MSQIIDKINQELIEALKAKDEVKVSTLRMLSAALKNRQIELGKELEDSQVLEVVAKGAKQHKESIAAYEAGGRQDLVEREKAELLLLEKYLPEQLSEEEITKTVEETIAEMGASGRGDTGKVIGAVMGKLKGKADGSVVSKVVAEKLS